MSLQTYPNTVDNRPVTSERSFESKNPATGEAIGLVPHSTAEQVEQAVRAARKAQPAWA
ncbi:aldehyde dehydrogenase family protein, partial [Variovorax sp. CT11-76]